jgi:PAS domain S-box-containing protein
MVNDIVVTAKSGMILHPLEKELSNDRHPALMKERGHSQEEFEAMRQVIAKLRKTNSDLHKQIEEHRLEAKTVRQNEQRLQAIIDRFRQLVEAVNDVLVLIRPGKPYSFTYVSPAHERLTGRKVSELYENPSKWLSFVHESDRNRIEQMFDFFLENRGEFNGEFRIVRPGGEVRWVWATGASVSDSGGEIYGLALTVRDITHKKLDEEKLENLVEEIKNFAYIVSHDFRAPLINIKGFTRELEVALEAIRPAVQTGLAGLNEEQRSHAINALEEDLPESLDFINSSVSRLDNLINAILEVSRLERRELRLEPLNMTDLVNELIKVLNFQLEEINAKVFVGELPEIVADRLSMEQIMTNLLINAVKFSVPERPQRIAISGWSFPEETVFVIRDEGRGIEPAYLSQIFQIFQRGSSHDVPGEGMGLAYVRALIRRHGGRIWCDSEIGRGSAFTFTVSNHHSVRRSPNDNS